MLLNNVLDILRVKNNLPAFRVGDTVKVQVKIKEGEKERIQAFEGLVIKKHGGEGKGASFTVRKISYGVGIERVFPYECASIAGLEVIKRGRVRRSKLFYLRSLVGKAAQVAEATEPQAPSAR